MKKIIINTGIMVFLSMQGFAQAATEQVKKSEPVQIPQMFFEPVTYIWLLMGFILIITIYALSRSVNALTRELERQVRGYVAEEEEQKMAEFVHKSNLWTKLMDALTRSVPVEHEKDVMLDHNYDGIRELDNQLPPWWKYGFYLTIIFAFIYLTVYHVSGTAKLQLAEYDESMKQAETERAERIAASANYITEDNVTVTTDANELAAGHDLFMKNCVACHGEKGEGKVGPNLTDDFWIHGGGVKNIFKTINEGVPAKGMISWKSQLSPKNIAELSNYILTLHGTNPPGAKEPQGDKWVEALAPADSTKSQTAATDSASAVAVK